MILTYFYEATDVFLVNALSLYRLLKHFGLGFFEWLALPEKCNKLPSFTEPSNDFVSLMLG